MVALRMLTVHASNRKGELKPISVVIKVRQGRKACTLLTGFEPFGLQADDLAEELRKTCASSTSGTSTLLTVRSKFTSVSDHIHNLLPNHFHIRITSAMDSVTRAWQAERP